MSNINQIIRNSELGGISELDLERFLDIPSHIIQEAFSEIEGGEKKTCWMWFIFPQLRGLGKSDASEFYGIINTNEAKRFLENTRLNTRLSIFCKGLLEYVGSAFDALGETDYQKLRSSMTLFSIASPNTGRTIFDDILERHFEGDMCITTITKMLKH